MSNMPTFHDWEVLGYSVDGVHRSVTFNLLAPRGQAQSATLLAFIEVEGYLLQHDLGGNIILSIEEQDLGGFLGEQQNSFALESKWGWPRFWKGAAGETADFLSSKESRVWIISASYGLSGWIVARDFQCNERG